MKRYINRLGFIAGCAIAFTACSDNSWNDKLDGFDATDGIAGNVQSLNYTLTSNDYKLIATSAENKAIAGEENAEALEAVSTQGYLTEVISAQKYVPALLSNVSFPYFTLDNGSAINITYRLGEPIPKQVSEIANGQVYTVSDDNYMEVWDSEEDFIASFSPSHSASRFIPGILANKYPDAEENQYVLVGYNNSEVDPIFDNQEKFTLSNVLGSISKGETVSINGYVAAVSTQGPIVCDASGAIFVYAPTNNSDIKVGDQVVINSTVDAFNYGFQIAKGSTPEITGTQKVTYPTPVTMTGADIDKLKADVMATDANPMSPIYAKFTGKAIVGNYINIEIDGTTVQLSPYGANDDVKALIKNGETVTLEGYAIAVASKGKFLNFITTKVGDTPIKVASAHESRGAITNSHKEYAVYGFNGSAWTQTANVLSPSHADYQAMNQKYDNFSDEETAAKCIPVMLRDRFPYAENDDTKLVAYLYYANSNTSIHCKQYVYCNGEWVEGNVITNETLQFVKSNGVWNYDPSVTVTLPAGRGIAISTLYYQTCVDWVKNNVPDGSAYVSSYGNNEYYCGTSAYQGNVDLRPSAAKTQYAGYDSMSDEEVVALEKERFEKEVMPAALSILHPDMAPVDGIQVTLTLNFYYYDGTTHEATAVFEVTGKGKFEYVSCTWNDAE